MANELQCDHTTGHIVYFQVRNSVGEIWNTVGLAFESYLTANVAEYDIAATEQGTGSGIYVGSMPVVTAGVYNVVAKDRAGIAPAESDATVGVGTIDWTGTAVVTTGTPMQANATERNKIADHVRRRTQPNVEASSDGDSLDLSSEYGFIQQAQESAVAVGVLTVKKTDGMTTLGTKTVTSDAAAEPITGLS